MKAVILAGGEGTRLWPVSRKNIPKQTKSFIGDQTLLEVTYKRLTKLFAPDDILVSTNTLTAPLIKKQLPRLLAKNLILEPTKRDTAPALGLVATVLHHRNPEETMVTAMSDAFIQKEGKYLSAIKTVKKTLAKYPNYSVMIGVNPTYPETQYGYIKLAKVFDRFGGQEVYRAKKFVEKPSLEQAKKYLTSWEYLWNPAMFAWRVDYLLSLYAKYLPTMYRQLKRVEAALDTKKENAVIKKEFQRMKKISIDYGIMEKIGSRMLVIPADIGWLDIGHWAVLKRALTKTKAETLTKGKVLSIDSQNNLIYSFSDKLVATVGLKDMIVIETDDALLVCPMHRAKDVKMLVEKLAKEKLTEYL